MMISNIYRDCFAQLSYEAVRDSGQPFYIFKIYRYFSIYSSIYQLFRIINMTAEYRVSDSFVLQQIDFPMEQGRKSIFQIQIVICIIFHRHIVEFDNQIYIALIRKAIRQD